MPRYRFYGIIPTLMTDFFAENGRRKLFHLILAKRRAFLIYYAQFSLRKGRDTGEFIPSRRGRRADDARGRESGRGSFFAGVAGRRPSCERSASQGFPRRRRRVAKAAGRARQSQPSESRKRKNEKR